MPPRAHEVERLARAVLGTGPVAVERVPIGFGNENWRVTDPAGPVYVLKIGPIDSAAKWRSARVSYELAASVGVPVPRLVHFAEHEEHVVRVFEWIDGRSPLDLTTHPERIATFFESLGTSVARLHSIELDAFSSRLDGSAPSFRSWADYVGYRLEQVRRRCSDSDAVDAATLDRACREIGHVAREVSDAARPTLCHRDLYADNLLVDDDGALLAILDWDMAEAWDAAGEWCKLDWLLFPEFPDGEATFDAAYRAIHPRPTSWRRRTYLVDLMETLNALANARLQGWADAFEARARSRLESLLARVGE
jgi:aminoglycoside phosphotransferase (APT) family kinase protein